MFSCSPYSKRIKKMLNFHLHQQKIFLFLFFIFIFWFQIVQRIEQILCSFQIAFQNGRFLHFGTMCNRLGAWCPRLQHRSVFGFPFASRNPFFTISSVISTSWTSEVPPTYSIYIRVGNQTYLSNLFALFPQKRQTRLVSETLQWQLGKKNPVPIILSHFNW